MKITELTESTDITEMADDTSILRRATDDIYHKMKGAGLGDREARHKIVILLRRTAAEMDFKK